MRSQSVPAEAGTLPDATAFANWLEAPNSAVAIVMFSLPHCGFCEIVRREQLVPLLRDAAYTDVAVFELSIQDRAHLLPATQAVGNSSSANRVSAAELAKHWGVRLSPTLHFITPRRQVADPLVGYAGADFYWGYLSARIETARREAASP